MFFIPGELISALTFPGVIIHEWAHKFFCERLGVPVIEVKYFQFGKKTAGYVLHAVPKTYKQTFWISVGPLLVNSLIAIIISFIALQITSGEWLWCLLLWLAISIGMHSFPSDLDMQNILSASKSALKEGGSFLHYLTFPFVWLIWLANKLSFFWFDAIWAFMLISIGGGFNAINKDVAQESDLSTQIDTCKVAVTTLGNQVNNDQTTLNNIETQMTQYQNEGDDIDYNNMVDSHNTLVNKIKEESSNYEIQRTACNNLVDQYNSNQ